MDIKWKRGEFHTFYANMKIRVGAHSGGEPVDLLEGDEFEYDGSICRYAGREFPQPSLRSAVREGWVSLDPSGTTPVARVNARDVAVSQSKNTDLSRVQRHTRAVLEQDSLDEETVISVSDRSAVRDARTGRGHLTKDNNKRTASTAGTFRGLDVTQSDLDEQDHTEIAKVRSPARLKVDVVNNPGIARQIETRTHEDGYGRFHGERKQPRSRTVEREGVLIKTNVGGVDSKVQLSEGEDGRVVGKVRHTDSKRSVEGVSVEDTSSKGRAEAKPAKPSVAKPAKPSVAKPAKPSEAKPAATASPKLKMAVRLYKDFPKDWNFFATPKDKIARVKEIGAEPKFLDALHATESAAVKKALEQEFSKHFS